MTQQTKHTPTPWFLDTLVGKTESTTAYFYRIRSNAGAEMDELVCALDSRPGDETNAETVAANSAFIVRACNAHEGWEAVEAYIKFPGEKELRSVLAALAKARGEA